MAYDSARDRLVIPAGLIVQEFDGVNWVGMPGVGGGFPMAFDEVRGRAVVLGLAATEEWDGVAWGSTNSLPPFSPSYWECRIAYHKGRGRVDALVPVYYQFPSERLELYEWDGASWSPVATPAQFTPLPITNLNPGQGDYGYGFLVFDERRDKLVLFGRSAQLAGVHVGTATTWEWDAVNGWIRYPDSGPLQGGGMWFDAHRGVVVRLGGQPPYTAYYWDPAQGWVPMGTVSAPSYYNASAYDSLRNRFYYGTSATSLAYVHDINPAEFVTHALGCAMPGAPSLRLTQPWTRAWMGNTLELTAEGLPLSLALLVMGFSDQSFASTPLPLDLSNYGMPGCQLRVAPDATLLGGGAHNEARFSLAIPNSASLLGVTFWQQILAPVPGANAAGVLMSDSVRGSVGRAY